MGRDAKINVRLVCLPSENEQGQSQGLGGLSSLFPHDSKEVDPSPVRGKLEDRKTL